MDQRQGEVLLVLMDGTRVEAVLTRSFVPEESEIAVQLRDSGELRSYLLARVCCIFMMPTQAHRDAACAEPTQEEITTVRDERYRVVVLKSSQGRSGIYGYCIGADTPLTLAFFTNHGIKSRRPETRVGEILECAGMVSAEAIKDALAEQKRLRDRKLGDILSQEHGLYRDQIENAIEKAHREGKISPRMKIGEILINAGLVTAEKVSEALTNQDSGKKKKIGLLLIEKGLITEEQLLMVLALKFRLRFVDLDRLTPSQSALLCIPAGVAQTLKILPLELRDELLVVATSEPTDYTIPDSLRFHVKKQVEMVVASPVKISRALTKFYSQQESDVGDILEGLSVKELEVDMDSETGESDGGISESDSHIVTLVNKILLDAYSKGASDIHFEPSFRTEPFQVRYRIDGTCRLVHKIPAGYKRAILSRIKIMSNLDISERRKPQSGKILMARNNQKIEFRVEVSPTVGGNEDAVLRILTSAEPLPLEDMGFSSHNMTYFKKALKQPYGMILCVGPTGSGKTTTLHSALKFINTQEIKIWTVEDPVEITQPGLRQVQVHAKIGLTFHEALRSFLRSDPDVIMVGEMRDGETAKTALEASLTGHLVLSTLHTNSAPETIVRLIEMGMDPFNFSDSLLAVLAQRLARRLCDRCKEPYHPDESEYDDLVRIYDPKWFREHMPRPYSAELVLMKKHGCDACNGTGYKGRVAIHELLMNTDAIKQMIRHKANIDEIRTTAIRESMKTLLMDGIHKIFQGVLDREELLRVCRYEEAAQDEIVKIPSADGVRTLTAIAAEA